MTDRISCCVPYCRRTARNDKGYGEWICGKHWPLVPRSMKRRRRELDRRVEKIKRMWDGDPAAQARIEGSGRYLKYCWTLQRAYQASYAAWDECKQAAIEAAAGIR